MSTRMRIAKMDREELLRRCKEGSIYADFVTIEQWNAVDGAWECSQCGCRKLEDTAFCPDCGSDMREGDVE